MNEFSIGGAWAKGFGFFFRSGEMHLRVLIGLGIILPLILQLLIAGGPQPLGNASTYGAPQPGAGFALIVVGLGSYALRLGSYFASWRLGFHPGEKAGGALGYGLIAASILLLAGGALAALAALASLSGLGASPAIALVLGIPLLLLVDAIYTAIVSATMVGTIILVLLVNLAPGLVARISPALAMTDSAWLVGMLLALALISWLAVRLSCTAAAMADHMRFNPFFGVAMSWRMTAPAQWRIMAFLATVGLALCLAVAGLALIFGIGIVSGFQPGGVQPAIGTALWIAGVAAAVPLAFLTVLVPAGIYRELRPAVPEEEIFA